MTGIILLAVHFSAVVWIDKKGLHCCNPSISPHWSDELTRRVLETSFTNLNRHSTKISFWIQFHIKSLPKRIIKPHYTLTELIKGNNLFRRY